MSKIVYSLLLVLLLNGIFFMADQTIQNTTAGGVTLYNYNNSIAAKYNSGNSNNFVIDNSVNGSISGTQNALDTSGFSFVDVFATFTNWIMNIPVLGVLFQILTAFHNVISLLPIPAAMIFMVDFIWYGVNAVLLFMFLRGDA